MVIHQTIWNNYSPWTESRSTLKPRVSILQDQNNTTFQKKKNFFRNKAVSDGAISFYLDHFVRTRISKITYGTFYSIAYDPSDPDHKSRSHKAYTSVSGKERIGSFDIMQKKVSCLISFLKSTIFKSHLCRMPKFRRRRNSERLITAIQILELIFDLLVFLFGVTVETSWLQSGGTLIPASHLTIIYFSILDELMFFR
jgi:hypothetical protein